jgi:hypothetical protein
MTATSEADADAEQPGDRGEAPATAVPSEVPAPPRTQRVDVRRRLMALRRW